MATSLDGAEDDGVGLPFSTWSTIAFCSSTLSGWFGTRWISFTPVVRAISSEAMRKAS